MSEKEIQHILKRAYDFTKTYEIQDLISVSNDYADLLTEIGKSQGFNTFELTENNKRKFGEILKFKRENIINLYNNTQCRVEDSGFNKNFLRSIPKNNSYNGAIVMIINFFALIRNKERRFNEKQTLLMRRDEMSGFKNIIEQMNKLIEIQFQEKNFIKTLT